jgi:hypothetical protein
VRFPFSSSFRMRVHAFGGLAAASGRGKASLLGRRGSSRARFSFGFSSRLRVHAFGGLGAALSCSKASLLDSRREEMICSGEVRLWRVATIQLRVSLQKVLQLSNGTIASFFNKKKSNTYRLGRILCGEQCGHVRHGVHV